MSGAQLTGPYFAHSYQVAMYKMAAKIPAVLHQQPCYCHCDREMGHNSLHSCFEGTQARTCCTCSRRSWPIARLEPAQSRAACHEAKCFGAPVWVLTALLAKVASGGHRLKPPATVGSAVGWPGLRSNRLGI